GLATALRPGQVEVTATSEKVPGTATLVVLARATSVEVSPPATLLYPGQSAQLTAIPLDAAGNALTRAVRWTSSQPAVATISPVGVVYALTSGTATIQAELDGVRGTAQLTVQPAVGTVTLVPLVSTILLGETLQLQAVVRDLAGTLLDRPVSWVSAPPAIALVAETGLVVPVARGIATINAFSEGKAGVAVVTIKAPVNAVTVEPALAS